MPYPYSWTPEQGVPTNASQVTVSNVDGSAATLSTAVAVNSGTITFATTNPGTYIVSARTSSDLGISKQFTVNSSAGAGTPTVAAGANAGTTPPVPVLVAGSNDSRGRVTFGTGATPAAGAMVTVTFSNPYAAIPFVIVAQGTATGSGAIYVSNVTAAGFTVGFTTAPTASQANTVYGFNYQVDV
jgi:hypothetical protein